MPASPPRSRPRITHGDARVLDDLAEIIRRREGAPRSESYTARLLAAGEPRIVRKLLEEANETALAALLESRAALCRESADLLYNLLVLWHARGISPEEVWKTLADRDAAHDTAAVKSETTTTARGKVKVKGKAGTKGGRTTPAGVQKVKRKSGTTTTARGKVKVKGKTGTTTTARVRKAGGKKVPAKRNRKG